MASDPPEQSVRTATTRSASSTGPAISIPIAAPEPPLAEAAPSTASAPAEVGRLRYDLILLDAGEGLVAVIRELRDLTGLTVSELAELVRAAPAIFELQVLPSHASAVKSRLEAAGARVEVRLRL
jgi:large subunit ribosomal protein L7/L12